MYRLVTALFFLKIPLYALKQYVSYGLNEQLKQNFVKDKLHKELTNCNNKKIGCYMALKSFKIVKIKASTEDLNYIEVTGTVEAYFYNVVENEILVVKVTRINQNYLELAIAETPNLKIDIPLDQVSSSSVSYNSTGVPYYLVGETQKIKEGDLLRTKILNYFKPVFGLIKSNFIKFRATCRNNGLGKIT